MLARCHAPRSGSGIRTSKLEMSRRVRSFELREADHGRAAILEQNLRDSEGGVAGARSIPEGFGDIYIFGAMVRDNIGETSPAQILGLLLSDPGPVLLGLGLPIESGILEIAAAGVPFKN